MSKKSALGEFIWTFLFFLHHFPRRTIAVCAGALLLSAIEMVSAAMILPLLSLGSSESMDLSILRTVEGMVVAFGFEYTAPFLFTVFIASLAAKAVSQYFIGVYIDASSVYIAQTLRDSVISALRRTSWSYFVERPHGLLINLMTQEIDRATGLFNQIQVVFVSACMMLVYVFLGVNVSFELLVASLLMAGLALPISRPMMRMARTAGIGHVEMLRDMAREVTQGLQAFKAFKAMAREKELLENLSNSNGTFVEASLLKVRSQRLLDLAQQVLLLVGLAGAFYVSVLLLGLSLVQVGFMAVVLMRINTNVANMLKKFQAVTNACYALQKIEEFDADMTSYREPESGHVAPRLPQDIVFENVHFSYEGRDILRKVSFTIPSTGLTALVGASGAGKTTILDLLCGFYRPASGTIRIGETDLAEIDQHQLRQMIGYVTQETILLNGTIAENVAAFDPAISDGDVLSALEKAGIRGLVETLPHGIHSPVGVNGMQLSGGERQRIAIARALAKKPRLLILDEPTAAVDPAAEAGIVEVIGNIAKEIAVIAISHQPALAKAAKRRYRLERGTVRPIDGNE